MDPSLTVQRLRGGGELDVALVVEPNDGARFDPLLALLARLMGELGIAPVHHGD